MESPVPGVQVLPPSRLKSHLPPDSMPPTVIDPEPLIGPVPLLPSTEGAAICVSFVISIAAGSLRVPSLSTATTISSFFPSVKASAGTPSPLPGCQVLPPSRLYSQSWPGFRPPIFTPPSALTVPFDPEISSVGATGAGLAGVSPPAPVGSSPDGPGS